MTKATLEAEIAEPLQTMILLIIIVILAIAQVHFTFQIYFIGKIALWPN